MDSPMIYSRYRGIERHSACKWIASCPTVWYIKLSSSSSIRMSSEDQVPGKVGGGLKFARATISWPSATQCMALNHESFPPLINATHFILVNSFKSTFTSLLSPPILFASYFCSAWFAPLLALLLCCDWPNYKLGNAKLSASYHD